MMEHDESAAWQVPGYPGARETQEQTPSLDRRNGKKQIYEEDTQHGDLEKFNRRGKHKGTVDPETGEIVKPPVKGRTIEV